MQPSRISGGGTPSSANKAKARPGSSGVSQSSKKENGKGESEPRPPSAALRRRLTVEPLSTEGLLKPGEVASQPTAKTPNSLPKTLKAKPSSTLDRKNTTPITSTTTKTAAVRRPSSAAKQSAITESTAGAKSKGDVAKSSEPSIPMASSLTSSPLHSPASSNQPLPPPPIRMGLEDPSHSLLYERVVGIHDRLKLQREQSLSSLKPKTSSDVGVDAVGLTMGLRRPVREEGIKHGKRILDIRTSGLKVKSHEMTDDGNCLFSAVAHQLFGDADRHLKVRFAAVKELQTSRDQYEFLFDTPQAYDDYVTSMSKAGTWGDEIMLKALVNAYNVVAYVLLSTPGNWYLRYVPSCCNTDVDILFLHKKRQLFLSYLSPVHYNSLTFDDGTPIMLKPDEASSLPQLHSHNN